MRTKNHIIWCMLPEIWVQHTIFCHFGSFFWPFTPLLAPKIKNWKEWRRYFLFRMCTINKDSWDIRRNRQKFSSFWVIFCPFIPLTNQKIKILKKWQKKKKNPGDVIILHLSTTNDNHMMYNVWFLRYGVQQEKSFLILDHFLSFYWKIKILKKRESLESSSYPCVPQMTITWCCMVP